MNASIVDPVTPGTEFKLPKPIETYVHAINARDEKVFASSFNHDAMVKDIGREIRGISAINKWAQREIFAVNVSLELMDARECGRQTIITVKVDGTFDRTGLPDPLMIDHCFTVAGGKIAELTCRLAARKVS